MTPGEIRDLSKEEIETRIDEEQTQLEQLRFQHAVAHLENPTVLRKKRRMIARLKTILNEKRQAEAQNA
jgi:large subunit ribosomal protein L29